eukprot:sb/3471914/
MAPGTRGRTSSGTGIDQFLLATTDVPARAKKLASSPDALATLFLTLHSVVNELRSENESLKATVASLQQEISVSAVTKQPDPEGKVSSLEDRLLKSEAYSGRSTAILTGIKESQDEDTVSVVVNTVKEIIPDFTTACISTAHRNKKKPTSDPTKPRCRPHQYRSSKQEETHLRPY